MYGVELSRRWRDVLVFAIWLLVFTVLGWQCCLSYDRRSKLVGYETTELSTPSGQRRRLGYPKAAFDGGFDRNEGGDEQVALVGFCAVLGLAVFAAVGLAGGVGLETMMCGAMRSGNWPRR